MLPSLLHVTRYRKSFRHQNRFLTVELRTVVYRLRSTGDDHTIPESLQKITLESPLAACPTMSCVWGSISKLWKVSTPLSDFLRVAVMSPIPDQSYFRVKRTKARQRAQPPRDVWGVGSGEKAVIHSARDKELHNHSREVLM